jgi:hypothetical protein
LYPDFHYAWADNDELEKKRCLLTLLGNPS